MIRWLTAREIADLYGRPIGTVYWLAHRDKWRRWSNARPVWYWAADVDDTMMGPLDKAGQRQDY